ncbi:hypothetical protein K440DRAFT_635871 [Wilcoxina mikolae CBS 423.85]|nr:hypothetical protein K440DRAFT_635871 [Wilcoxina mikolae CBS 423.85]
MSHPFFNQSVTLLPPSPALTAIESDEDDEPLILLSSSPPPSSPPLESFCSGTASPAPSPLLLPASAFSSWTTGSTNCPNEDPFEFDNDEECMETLETAEVNVGVVVFGTADFDVDSGVEVKVEMVEMVKIVGVRGRVRRVLRGVWRRILELLGVGGE